MEKSQNKIFIKNLSFVVVCFPSKSLWKISIKLRKKHIDINLFYRNYRSDNFARLSSWNYFTVLQFIVILTKIILVFEFLIICNGITTVKFMKVKSAYNKILF